ncbi:alpha/beta hydrolase [Kitasatospora paracochleata]|uniref:Pimeloyl-ACP methyl ester carboxylesterase n=1 Tax=Kitasatospora paracochleata TaxID=58354 RepID=A0ABT1J8W2_9ACTN|nr:alpha/beta fold hydrolase [Kitasatospora paracochleata]MCP2313883.1 pimeloyl-ACP methyl ester carboxylesterase [Kitasatospora paracochleata]
MTTFVLVPGWFTGGGIWQEVAGRLRAAGAQVHPVTLTGLGGPDPEGGPGPDLETHIADVVRLLDEPAAPEVVIVGHGYGIHPVLGAADRRPERVARVVYLDAPLAGDGDEAARTVPDRRALDLLGRGVAAIPVPAVGEWERWGSTAGLDGPALARLTALAVPHPAATLTQPLRLTGEAAALPTTGVLCTAGGATIAMVENLVAGGPPQFRALADPKVTFFELPAGHWPMLSHAEELAEVLLAAAAGQGHRIGVPGEPPAYLRPFVLDVPDAPRERVGRFDLHLPDGVADGSGPRPAVVFVHGGPLPAGMRPTPRDWTTFRGYGRLAAAHGAIGVTLDHRLHGFGDFGRAADDLADTVDRLRADPRIDPDRIALWHFSGAGLLLAPLLAAPPPWLRCVAASYPVLAPLPGWAPVDPRFRPVGAVSGAGRLPVVLTRVGRENPAFAATVAEFLAAAQAYDAQIEVIDVPDGRHAFDTLDPGPQSREAVERAMRSVLTHLRA